MRLMTAESQKLSPSPQHEGALLACTSDCLVRVIDDVLTLLQRDVAIVSSEFVALTQKLQSADIPQSVKDSLEGNIERIFAAMQFEDRSVQYLTSLADVLRQLPDLLASAHDDAEQSVTRILKALKLGVLQDHFIRRMEAHHLPPQLAEKMVNETTGLYNHTNDIELF
jgi:hypothetical protein